MIIMLIYVWWTTNKFRLINWVKLREREIIKFLTIYAFLGVLVWLLLKAME